jgi:hypothetical protein
MVNSIYIGMLSLLILAGYYSPDLDNTNNFDAPIVVTKHIVDEIVHVGTEAEDVASCPFPGQDYKLWHEMPGTPNDCIEIEGYLSYRAHCMEQTACECSYFGETCFYIEM